MLGDEDMENKMTKHLALEGLKVGDTINLRQMINNPHKVTIHGIVDCLGNSSELLTAKVLLGEIPWVSATWEPKKGETYWRRDMQGSIRSEVWYGNIGNLMDHHCNNVYRTRMECHANEKIFLQTIK